MRRSFPLVVGYGSRLHVVIPDITRRQWSVNIRKFVVRATHLDDLGGAGQRWFAAATADNWALCAVMG
ncbi:MAG: hypothetical protein H0U61_13195 [Nocardioidaceae bacterium]|nr:hypothetical protein [Nocardioidaceae bacterium]